MPCLSRFYGIAIDMYGGDHNPPHFHARHGGQDAAIDVRTSEVLVGRIPQRAMLMVREWTGLHREELIENWERLARGEAIREIEPLP